MCFGITIFIVLENVSFEIVKTIAIKLWLSFNLITICIVSVTPSISESRKVTKGNYERNVLFIYVMLFIHCFSLVIVIAIIDE